MFSDDSCVDVVFLNGFDSLKFVDILLDVFKLLEEELDIKL